MLLRKKLENKAGHLLSEGLFTSVSWYCTVTYLIVHPSLVPSSLIIPHTPLVPET